ncbi:MAG: DUF2339 domain-containing protein [Rubricoccaceae bacterium]
MTDPSDRPTLPPSSGAAPPRAPGSAVDAARIEALEARVAALEATLARAEAARPARPRRTAQPLTLRWREARSEDVLGKVGIALLLVGVLFLLKYSLDRDLLTPAVRVAGAGAIGALLVGLGLRLRRRRPTLGRLLTGGGIAALYGTLWTASTLYPLLPLWGAFGAMVGVAALALGLAVRERDAALSVVGTLGGLMTPLLLYREPGQMAALSAYTALLVGAAGAVFAQTRWPALLSAAAAGGWAVMLVAWFVGLLGIEPVPSVTDRLAFSAGVAAVFAATGLLPLVVPPVLPSAQARWRASALAAIAGPLAALALLDAAWTWPDAVAAALLAATGVTYGAAAYLRRGDAARFVPLVVASAALATWAAGRTSGAADGLTLGVGTALGTGLAWLGRRDRLADLEHLGHAAALLGALALGVYLYATASAEAVAPRKVAAGALGLSALLAHGLASARGSRQRLLYLTAGHTLVLLLLRLVLLPQPEAAGLTSGAWGLYGVATLVAGLRLRDDVLRQVGLGTVLLTVAKVLVFDLSAIPTLWRVLLFTGLGALLLAVSYLVPSLLRGEGGDVPEGTPSPPRA